LLKIINNSPILKRLLPDKLLDSCAVSVFLCEQGLILLPETMSDKGAVAGAAAW
jgi:hypothetical protein